jgi:small conductance mechanosensitive channel
VLRATGNEWMAAASDWLIAKPLSIAIILAVAFVVRWIVNRLIVRAMVRASKGAAATEVIVRRGRGRSDAALRAAEAAAERRQQRAETMGSVLRSIASFAIFAIAGIMVVSELGYDVAPLLASAGIVGLGLGFGAQSLVKDFLSGIFMFFEDQYGVGDVITVNDITGTVEALTLRVTRLRNEEGTVWYVRNGEILKVCNKSQRF